MPGHLSRRRRNAQAPVTPPPPPPPPTVYDKPTLGFELRRPSGRNRRIDFDVKVGGHMLQSSDGVLWLPNDSRCDFYLCPAANLKTGVLQWAVWSNVVKTEPILYNTIDEAVQALKARAGMT